MFKKKNIILSSSSFWSNVPRGHIHGYTGFRDLITTMETGWPIHRRLDAVSLLIR